MSKTKHNPSQKPKSNFIPFSELQTAYLNEVHNRTQNDRNFASEVVCKEIGILEKMQQAPPGTYRFREDFSGLDVFPIKPSGKDN